MHNTHKAGTTKHCEFFWRLSNLVAFLGPKSKYSVTLNTGILQIIGKLKIPFGRLFIKML